MNLPAGTGLLILDDYFPNVLSGFRVAEFVHYLRVFPGLLVASTVPDFDRFHAQFAAIYPDLSPRVIPWTPQIMGTARGLSMTFLNNAAHWHKELEGQSIPFIFTLYPGGGFDLNDPVSAEKLERVLASPMLRGVVATQPVTAAELERLGCRVPVIYVPGLVVSPSYLTSLGMDRTSATPGALRICFAAYRYDEAGRSKGYPEFLAAAAILAENHPAAEFAVVGNFGPEDIPVPAVLQPRLTFHGPLSTMALRQFFQAQDVIVSPSRRYALTGREFDGFPTGTSVEASLCGVAVLSSDELSQNRHYVDGQEILICRPDAEAIVAHLWPLIIDPRIAARIGERGRRRTVVLYGPKAQLIPRTRLLRRLAEDVGIPLQP